MAIYTGQHPSWGVRRRYRGKMVLPNGKPRSHHIDQKMAPIKWENAQRIPTDTKAAPKCEAPKNKKQGRGIGGNARLIGS